ncbi:hypothetical protein L6R53_17880 [Myxococcota bacterium]|nr:hypothetical protein [Myxococcota bacterium]
MHKLALLLPVLACSEPDTEDDTGPTGTTGATGDGGTSTVELCREVETPFDEDTAPVSSYELWEWYDAIISYGAVTWASSLDGVAESEVSLGGGWPGSLSIVDWVADGSEEAIYPCRAGPASRVWLDFNVVVQPVEARGTVSGALDGNGVDFWLTRVRSTTPSLSEDWQALVDDAEDDAGHPDATTFMALDNPGGPGTVLTIGSEAASWSQDWWSGPLEEGDLVPQ